MYVVPTLKFKVRDISEFSLANLFSRAIVSAFDFLSPVLKTKLFHETCKARPK
jgi:hypothetical protein